MKITIVGAGAVGTHLARSLSWEGHEVVIIDVSQDIIDQVQNSMDVLAIRGNATSISTLVKAGIQSSDLLLAVTNVDEVNIVTCMLAAQFGVATRIARIRNQEYSHPNTPVDLSKLGITQVIHPELETARVVVRLIQYPDAFDFIECADGKLYLVGLKIDVESSILNKPLRELNPVEGELNFRLVAVNREGRTIIPTGDFHIKLQDIIYVICKIDDIKSVFDKAGKPISSTRNVMILGGNIIGRMVAEQLEKEKRHNVKIIESDIEKSEMAAQRLQNTMVVFSKGGMDLDILTQEGLNEMDVFAALTDDDENNIVTSLFARHLKVKRTITLISKPIYMPVVQTIGLDAAINERLLTTDAILKFLRGGRIINISSLRGIRAEIIEYYVEPNSKVAGRRLRDIEFPEGVIIGAVDHRGEIEVAIGNTIINSGDRVVVFSLQQALSKIEKFFN